MNTQAATCNSLHHIHINILQQEPIDDDPENKNAKNVTEYEVKILIAGRLDICT